MTNGTTVIKDCNCNHAFQDSLYGLGKRAMNVGGTTDSKVFRCTVCNKEQSKAITKGK